MLNFFSRPSIYIGVCVVLWGLFSALTGVRFIISLKTARRELTGCYSQVTTNEAGIIICRFLIGIPEVSFTLPRFIISVLTMCVRLGCVLPRCRVLA